MRLSELLSFPGGLLFQKICAAIFGMWFGATLTYSQTADKRMADFDGDGRKDIAVFRPSNGTWYIQGSGQGYWEYQWGISGDIPVPGDYTGYGRAGAAIFRRFNSTWFISPVGSAPYQVQFGLQGDIPVPGDFDGDGKTDIAVFRPSNGTWYITGTSRGYWEQQWGCDLPPKSAHEAYEKLVS